MTSGQTIERVIKPKPHELADYEWRTDCFIDADSFARGGPLMREGPMQFVRSLPRVTEKW